MGEWRECKLGDIADVKGGKRLPKGELLTTEKTPHPYVRITDFNGYKINLSNILYVNEEVQKSISRYIVNKQDIILSIVGTIGLCAKVPDELDNANLTENCIKLVFDKTKIDTNFLYYHLISPDTQELIGGLDVGSTQPKLPIYNVQKIDISLPPLEEQKAIAEVLSSLDDKIDLLHRQNKTLEELAQTLFRQWFIEEAKEEWEEQSLFDSIKLVGGGTPKTTIAEYWDGNIGWLAGGDISSHHKSFVQKTVKTITKEGLEKSSARLLPKYATVISARGTVGKYCLLAEPMAFSQSNYGILPKFENCYFFTYLLISHSVDELQAAAYGSVFDTITTITFQEQSISLPDEQKIQEFEKQIESYFEKIESNTKQIQTLENLRDTLLPKLMSGEVRVEG